MTSFESEYEPFHEEKRDTRAQYDEYTLYEIEHDRQLNVICNFKSVIACEPEFCGIYSLSSYVILRAFMDSKNSVVNLRRRLTKEQLSIFQSVYFEIYNKHADEIYLDKIAVNISEQVYV